MAISAEDKTEIENYLNEHYVLVRRDVEPKRTIPLAVSTICVLALVETIILISRATFIPILTDFETSLSLISTLALDSLLPMALGFVILATLAKEFIPGLLRVANTWNRVVLGIALVAVAIHIVGVGDALISLFDELS